LSDQQTSANSTSHAQPINSNVGHGRLDIYQAVSAWAQAVGAN
jgi:hypothetical protein